MQPPKDELKKVTELPRLSVGGLYRLVSKGRIPVVRQYDASGFVSLHSTNGGIA